MALCALRSGEPFHPALLGNTQPDPSPGPATAGAVNGAIEALGRSLAVELASVRVNVVSPGLIQATDASKDMPNDVVMAMVEGAASRLPALTMLASPYITGTVVDIDGGALLSG